jgi:hypothetical protein
MVKEGELGNWRTRRMGEWESGRSQLQPFPNFPNILNSSDSSDSSKPPNNLKLSDFKTLLNSLNIIF